MKLDIIGYNIKYFRERFEWSQQELANKLLISRSAIAKWERNIRLPDIASLVKLSEIFNVSLDQLAGTHFYHDNLLKDFKRMYSSNNQSFDEEVLELVEYLMHHPHLKEQVFRLQELPLDKQLSLHRLFSDLINQYERL